MFSDLFYKFILIILHFIVNIFEFSRLTWEYLKTNMIDRSLNNDCSDLSVRINTLNKVPRHLTVLLGREKPSYKDLANVVLWSIASGISFVSFYDNGEVLKRNDAKLRYEVEKRKKDCHHIIWHNSFDNTYKNGFNGSKIHVKILGPTDGRDKIAITCKRLIAEGSLNVDVKLIDSYLKVQYEFPNPDLGIYCGRTFSLYDYPPWQISVTEFINLRSHHNITFTTFLDLLQRYNKCEQRLGK